MRKGFSKIIGGTHTGRFDGAFDRSVLRENHHRHVGIGFRGSFSGAQFHRVAGHAGPL